MAVYTHLENDEIAELLTAYQVGELRFAVGITQGVENSNYLLEVEQDGSAVKYILTLYEQRVNANDLPFFMALKEHVYAKGVPCPLPVKRLDGDVISTVKGRPAALITFLHGHSHTRISPLMTAELGKALAQLHAATEDFTLQRPNGLALEGWLSLYNQVKPLGHLLPDEQWRSMLRALESELTWLAAHWPSELPSGVIHADLFPDNVFFEGEQLSGLIDFYFACNDLYMYDVAICLNCWCFEQHGAEFNVTKAKRLLAAYHKVRPISEAELHALPILARGAALRFLLTRLYDMLHQKKDAHVQIKDPMEYWQKLQFHQRVQSHAEYGL